MTHPIPGADERELFEKAMSDRGEACQYIGDGLYKYDSVNLAYDLWLARAEIARAAAKVGANVCMNSAALADLACPTCHGTGQMCVGRSGQESDGNGPVMEPCSECGYFEPGGDDVAADLEFNAQRLRNVAHLVGLEGAIPEDDANLDGARAAVLGMIARRLRGEAKLDAFATGAPASIAANLAADANDVCQLPPADWYCTRKAGHDGPCAAIRHAPDRELDAGDQAAIARGMARLAAGAPAEKPKPVIGAGDPEAFFVLFCEANGYPSDSEIDEALRAAYYEGIKYCCTLAAQPITAPIAGDVEKDAARLDWLEAQQATLSRLHDNSGYILAVDRKAVRTGKTAREAIDAAMLAPTSSAEAG